jgi:hypothetical protein
MVNGFHFCTFLLFVLPLLYNIWHAKKVKKKVSNRKKKSGEKGRRSWSHLKSILKKRCPKPTLWLIWRAKELAKNSGKNQYRLFSLNTAFNYSLNWAWKWEEGGLELVNEFQISADSQHRWWNKNLKKTHVPTLNSSNNNSHSNFVQRCWVCY